MEAVGGFVLYTVIEMLLLVTEDGEAHVRLLDISQVTTFPVVSDDVTYGEPLHTGQPSTYQM